MQAWREAVALHRGRWVYGLGALVLLGGVVTLLSESVPLALLTITFGGVLFLGTIESVRPLPADWWRPGWWLPLVRVPLTVATVVAPLALLLEFTGLFTGVAEYTAAGAAVALLVGALGAGFLLRFLVGGLRGLLVHAGSWLSLPILFFVLAEVTFLLALALLVYPLALAVRWQVPIVQPDRLYESLAVTKAAFDSDA